MNEVCAYAAYWKIHTWPVRHPLIAICVCLLYACLVPGMVRTHNKVRMSVDVHRSHVRTFLSLRPDISCFGALRCLFHRVRKIVIGCAIERAVTSRRAA